MDFKGYAFDGVRRGEAPRLISSWPLWRYRVQWWRNRAASSAVSGSLRPCSDTETECADGLFFAASAEVAFMPLGSYSALTVLRCSGICGEHEHNTYGISPRGEAGYRRVTWDSASKQLHTRGRCKK